MGKRIISQRRGRGTSRFRNHALYSKGSVQHYPLSPETVSGTVVDLVHCANHTAPIAYIAYDDGKKGVVPAPELLRVGTQIYVGASAPTHLGNTLPLSSIPDGTAVYNLELRPGDGGRLVRAAGTCARVVGRTENGVLVKLPSKKIKEFLSDCRATIGVIAGGGRHDKPFVKAGKKWHAAHATGKLFPHTSAVAMNAVNHPFGSGRGRHVGKSKNAPRNAPPGRKVGQIRARRTGRRR